MVVEVIQDGAAGGPDYFIPGLITISFSGILL